MLTDASIRDLLRAGFETNDDDFVAHPKDHVGRIVYFMAQFLAEHRNRYISSVDLQGRIDDQLWTSRRPAKIFNAVDWFSSEWTNAKMRSPTTKYFLGEYLELFDRGGESPTSYRIKPALFDGVARILSELHAATHSILIVPSSGPDPGAQKTSPEGTSDRRFPNVDPAVEVAPDLSALAEQLDKEGAFDPTSLEDARMRTLRTVIVREGQPLFRAALVDAYGGRCAITECDAPQALEAAHVKPYDGVTTNVVNNGILLRADIHTLFDLDLLGIDPSDGLVHISNRLEETVYQKFEGAPLRQPDDDKATPNSAALAWRWERFLGQS